MTEAATGSNAVVELACLLVIHSIKYTCEYYIPCWRLVCRRLFYIAIPRGTLDWGDMRAFTAQGASL